MKKFKFPDNKLNFKKIIIIPYYISLLGSDKIVYIENTKNKLSVNINSCISKDYHIDKNKTCDFSVLLDYYKMLDLTLYKFPENNFGIKYITIQNNITLLHEKGYYIEISENDITMGEMLEYL